MGIGSARDIRTDQSIGTTAGTDVNRVALGSWRGIPPQVNLSAANFTEMNLAKVALQNGVAESTVTKWRRQLKEAEQEGRFSFTVIGVVTTGYLA